MKLVFATTNQNKLNEAKQLLPEFEIIGLKDLGHEQELQENHETFEENASQKSWFVYDKYNIDCFAEDAGLEVEVLGNAPGVHSARYAGNEKDPQANMRKLMEEMEGKSNRKARFRTVIYLIINRMEHCFEGIVEGRISEKPMGSGGFGYDPVFIPDGEERTFAQMPLEEKNKISHRGIALRQMVDFLKEQYEHLAVKNKLA